MNELPMNAGADQDRGGAGSGTWLAAPVLTIVVPVVVARVRRKRRKKKEVTPGLDPWDKLEDMSRGDINQGGRSRRQRI